MKTVTLVAALVRMLCGCPHTPGGGLWDAGRISVKARLYEGAWVIREAILESAGEPNRFTGAILSRMQARTPGWWCSPTMGIGRILG